MMEIIGLNKENVKRISEIKEEEEWVRNFRLNGYKSFINQNNPSFGPKIDLNYDDIIYYKSNEVDKKLENDWNNILKPVKDELNELGVIRK